MWPFSMPRGDKHGIFEETETRKRSSLHLGRLSIMIPNEIFSLPLLLHIQKRKTKMQILYLRSNPDRALTHEQVQ